MAFRLLPVVQQQIKEPKAWSDKPRIHFPRTYLSACIEPAENVASIYTGNNNIPAYAYIMLH